MKKFSALILLFTILLCSVACNKMDLFDFRHQSDDDDASKLSSRVATEWYRLQLRILLERNSSLNSVYFGYIGIGLYEAVRNMEEDASSFSVHLNQMPAMPAKEKNKKYNWEVSANAALASLVRSYYTGLSPANNTSIDSLEAAFNAILKPNASSEVFKRSQDFGRSIAKAVYDWSLTDGFNPSNAGYVPPVFPGAWEPTPPAFAGALQPFMSAARPLMTSNISLTVPPPMAYSTDTASDFYKMVKEVYNISKTLTADQKSTALYWVDQGNGIGYTPPGHDFFIVTQAIEKYAGNLFRAAEAYAKAGIAEREGWIVCFRSKYQYSLLRPVTYIRNQIDPSWLPFIPTPPHPEYPAAHAMVTGSVMQALSRVLGTNVPVTDRSYEFRGWPARTYANFFAAAEEAGISRLYGGIHYRNSIQMGWNMAKKVGTAAGDIRLKE